MKNSLPRWAAEWIVIVLFISTIPYLVALIITPEGSIFSGILLNITDTNSYFAEMQIGFNGDWLFQMPYSSHPSKPIPLFAFYILLGHLTRLLDLPVPFVYHFTRIVFSGVFLLLCYRFIARLTSHEREQKLAMGIVLFTGGIGWLMIAVLGVGIAPYFTPDIWIFDAISFGAILGFPHFVLNMALMLWMLIASEDFMKTNTWQKGLEALVAGLVIAFIHPQQLIVLGAIMLTYVILGYRRSNLNVLRKMFQLVLVFGPPSIIALALTFNARLDPYLASWLDQVNTYSPPPWSLLILYGPIFILALIGLFEAIRMRDRDLILAVIWFIIVLILLYIPLKFQRRFIEGWHVPVAILGSIGWFRIVERRIIRVSSPRVSNYLLAVLFITVAISPIFLLATTIGRATITEGSESAFITPDELGAIKYLRNHAEPYDVLLASFFNGNRLPAHAPVRSFLGHWDQTPFVKQRMDQVRIFYDHHTPNNQRIALLREFGITFVYYSEAEKKLGDFSPDRSDFLIRVYWSPAINIYKVNLPDT